MVIHVEGKDGENPTISGTIKMLKWNCKTLPSVIMETSYWQVWSRQL